MDVPVLDFAELLAGAAGAFFGGALVYYIWRYGGNATAPITWSCRVYRRLLMLYPRKYRQFSDELIHEFREACHDTYKRRGFWALSALWARTLLDLPGSLLGEYKEEIEEALALGEEVEFPWLIPSQSIEVWKRKKHEATIAELQSEYIRIQEEKLAAAAKLDATGVHKLNLAEAANMEATRMYKQKLAAAAKKKSSQS